MATMQITAMRATRRAYSTRLAPRSSRPNLARRYGAQCCCQYATMSMNTPMSTPPKGQAAVAHVFGRLGGASDRAIGPFCGRNVTKSEQAALVQANDAHAHGLQLGLRAVPCIQFLVNGRQVVLHRLHADVQLGRHLGGRK